MSFDRPLRGGCHCGRNSYVVQFPKDTAESVQVVFNAQPTHRISQASPLPAFVRVPLEWYHSTTIAYYPDETSAMIRKVYTADDEQQTRRHFCGFCGTPLSFWSENPRSEAEYIQLTLGSLSGEDLHDLEDLGLLPDSDEDASEDPGTPGAEQDEALGDGDEEVIIHTTRETLGGLPWLDALLAGSKLAHLRAAERTSSQGRVGSTRIEWEIIEWTEDDPDDEDPPRASKRKFDERAEFHDGASSMEGIER